MSCSLIHACAIAASDGVAIALLLGQRWQWHNQQQNRDFD